MTPCEPRTSPTLEIPATLNLCPRAGQRCRCRHALPRSRDLPRTAPVPFYRSRRHDRRQDRQTATNLFRLARRPPAGHRRGALSPPRTKNPPDTTVCDSTQPTLALLPTAHRPSPLALAPRPPCPPRTRRPPCQTRNWASPAKRYSSSANTSKPPPPRARRRRAPPAAPRPRGS